MSKRAILRLDGSLETGFHVTLEVGAEGNLNMAEGDGHLAASPELIACLAQWQSSYGDLSHGTRIKVNNIRVQKASTQSVEVCRRDGQALQLAFQGWLGGEAFRSIDMQLREVVTHDDLVRVVIRTKDRRLHLLPWHTWRFVDHYRAEVGFSLPSRQAGEPVALSQFGKVKILAILGHSEGIDTEADRLLLKGLPDADVKFLVEPDRQQINDQLWEQRWDILFFAGHSLTRDGAGLIHINPEDCLSVEDLKFGLRRAIDRGLQLAIFNSCDGLGLAYEVEQLGLPQMVVMRQPVPDPVAQAFLKDLLTSFVGGQRFYLAVREAREKLQGFEQRYPCASWLPVIFQNPTQPALSWDDFRDSRGITQGVRKKLISSKKRVKRRTVLLLITLLASAIVGGVQSSTWIEAQELVAYDKLQLWNSHARAIPPLLIVWADNTDLNLFGGDPLSDQVIDQVIEKISKYSPKVIGLDIYRPKPTKSSPKDFKRLANRLGSNSKVVALCKVGEVEGASNPSIAPPPGMASSQLGYSDALLPDTQVDPKEDNPEYRYPVDDKDPVRRYSISMDLREKSTCRTEESFAAKISEKYWGKAALEKAIQKLPSMTDHFGGYRRPKADLSQSRQVLISYQEVDKIVQTPLSFKSILREDNDNDFHNLIQDKIVLVGYKDNPDDSFTTVLGPLSGVLIHAQMIQQLGRIIQNKQLILKSLPDWSESALMILLGLGSGFVTWLLKVRLGIVFVIGQVLCSFLIATVTWSLGYWLPIVSIGCTILVTSLLVWVAKVFHRQFSIKTMR
jgi:CHASE2 domain-containing sensor protein